MLESFLGLPSRFGLFEPIRFGHRKEESNDNSSKCSGRNTNCNEDGKDCLIPRVGLIACTTGTHARQLDDLSDSEVVVYDDDDDDDMAVVVIVVVVFYSGCAKLHYSVILNNLMCILYIM